MRKRSLLLAPLLAVAAVPLSAAHSGQAAGRCGVERWAVKTGIDGDAGSVSMSSATPTNIAYLGAQPRPGSIDAGSRSGPVETSLWVLDATLVEDKRETDSDYHLVLRDAEGRSMVAEIPSPGCVGDSSPFLSGIRSARQSVDAQYSVADFFATVDVPVRVTGIGFWDTIHGQTGVAPNGVELHPVTAIEFSPTTPLASPRPPPAVAGTGSSRGTAPIAFAVAAIGALVLLLVLRGPLGRLLRGSRR